LVSSKVDPMWAMKVGWGRCIAPLTLNIGSKYMSVISFTPKPL
jgi:hypothetical protein